MSTVEHKSDVAAGRLDQAAPKKTMGTLEIILIVAGVLGVAALIAYQVFGCAGCYAPI
jgi:hypothetical protein